MATKSAQLWLVDGQMDFAGGVDSGRVTSIQTTAIPHGLPRNMVAWLSNATARLGSLMPRTGWLQRVVLSGVSGRFQGGFIYQGPVGYPYLVLVVGGRVLQVDPDSALVTDLSAQFALFLPITDKCYFVQAEEFLIIQAGDFVTTLPPTLPLFWDGTTLRRSKGITNTSVTPGTPAVNEIPAANAMVYYQQRLWYTQQQSVNAGDIVGGNSGSAPYGFRDAVLNVTENPLCVGGDGFAVPTQAGNITAVGYTANLNTNLGQGPLYVFTRREIYSLTVPMTRSDWISATATNAPQMVVVQVRYGTSSDRSLVHSNGDLYYQTMEPGIRSLILAVRDYNMWGNTPISKNVQRVQALSNRSLLHVASGIQFDNRLWQTCLPIETPVGIAHQGLVVLDFDLVSSLQDKLQENAVPAWEGMYEPGLTLQLWEKDFGGLERAFAALWFPQTSTIEIWEPTSYAHADAKGSRVPWLIETPAYNWNQPFARKELETAQLWFDQIDGTVIAEIYYREDGNPCWHPWAAFQLCTRTDSGGVYPSIFCPSGQIPLTLPKAPAYDCNDQGNRPCNLGCQFQLRLVLRGWCRLRGLMLFAQPRETELYTGLVCPPQFPPPPLT